MEHGAETAGGGLLARYFSEKRIFLKSDAGTRFVRIGPRQQFAALMCGTALLGWAVFASSFVVAELAGSGRAELAEQNEQALYEDRLTHLAQQRDDHEHAAVEAQAQFGSALDDISRLQEELFQAKLQVKELQSGREAMRTLLQRATSEREILSGRLAAVESDSAVQDAQTLSEELDETAASLDFMTGALSRTAADRDAILESEAAAVARVAELEHALQLNQQANDRIFAQLEDAVTLSMEPLDKMFRSAGLSPDSVIDQMRSRYSGQGGPLTPITFSTKGTPMMNADSMRANTILSSLDNLNLYRMAVEKLPFARPVAMNVRQTSGFGYRRDPFGRGGRMHEGLDWAGSYGTPISTTADGVVVRAGWMSGYGRVVDVRHEFGIVTRYAHMSKIHVKVGQRVSRGDKIGAMGNSGRSTGTHLHYEVHVGGKPVDPMTYLKAARDVL